MNSDFSKMYDVANHASKRFNSEGLKGVFVKRLSEGREISNEQTNMVQGLSWKQIALALKETLADTGPNSTAIKHFKSKLNTILHFQFESIMASCDDDDRPPKPGYKEFSKKADKITKKAKKVAKRADKQAKKDAKEKVLPFDKDDANMFGRALGECKIKQPLVKGFVYAPYIPKFEIPPQIKEGLVDHAKRELTLANMFKVEEGDACNEWNNLVAEAVMELMEVFAEQGHSGFSASMCTELFSRLSKYEALTELTNNSDEWMDVTEMSGGNAMWQSRRNPSCFSTDEGKTYYDIDDESHKFVDEDGVSCMGRPEDHGKKTTMYTSKSMKEAGEHESDAYEIKHSQYEGGGEGYGIKWLDSGRTVTGFTSRQEAINNAERYLKKHPKKETDEAVNEIGDHSDRDDAEQRLRDVPDSLGMEAIGHFFFGWKEQVEFADMYKYRHTDSRNKASAAYQAASEYLMDRENEVMDILRTGSDDEVLQLVVDTDKIISKTLDEATFDGDPTQGSKEYYKAMGDLAKVNKPKWRSDTDDKYSKQRIAREKGKNEKVTKQTDESDDSAGNSNEPDRDTTQLKGTCFNCGEEGPVTHKGQVGDLQIWLCAYCERHGMDRG